MTDAAATIARPGRRTPVATFLLALCGLTTPTAHGQDEARRLDEVRSVVQEFQQTLGAALKKELAAGGPERAIEVCRTLAPQIAGDLSRRTGWHVARISLRTRNPLLGLPDAWEQEALRDFDRRATEGAKPESLETSAQVTEPAGRYLRYVRAIPTQPLCLACHGKPEALDPAVATLLDQAYPHDAARGYSAGQIRGAFTVKRPLD